MAGFRRCGSYLLVFAAFYVAGCSGTAGPIRTSDDSGTNQDGGTVGCDPGTWRKGKASAACARWSDCAAGTYIDAEGSATQDRECTACAQGTFSSESNEGSCTKFVECVPGTYAKTAGTATNDRICIPCEDGFYNSFWNSSVCAMVGECAPGTRQTAPATIKAATQCAPCTVGTFCVGGTAEPGACGTGTWDDDGNPASACVAWTDCAAGAMVNSAGSAITDRTCSPCADGTYSAETNATSCTPGCPAGFTPTSVMPLVCNACAPGSFCEGGMTAPFPCELGTWDQDGSAASACVAWSDCSAGTYNAGAGSSTADRSCEPCASGTFSTTTNAASCDAFTNCLPGQYVSAGGDSPSRDRTCSACADGSWSATANAISCDAWTTCSADQYEIQSPTATSDRQCANYRSCLDWLTRVPSSPSGNYVIDPDGPGSAAALSVPCDMVTAGGGWTVISFEDFASSAAGWSNPARDTSSSCFTAYGAMLGGFNLFGNGASSAKTYDLLGVSHTQVRVDLDYYVIDSWDGERGQVFVDGTRVYHTSFNFSSAASVCGGSWGEQGRQDVVVTQSHDTNSVLLNVTSTLDQPPNDEAFGVDNVLIMVR